MTRPAVEAGEPWFLPGDLKEKVDLIYDWPMMLLNILGKDQTTRMMEREIIEIAPLAYMCGVILTMPCHPRDEAQNTTHHADEDAFDPSWF